MKAPESVSSYTCFHLVDDLISLLDAVAANQEKVFVVGHDWGATIGWYLCLFRPDKVKAYEKMKSVMEEEERDNKRFAKRSMEKDKTDDRNL
ncbi:hypothetical protein SLA2020_025250 [Shorea laevis]